MLLRFYFCIYFCYELDSNMKRCKRSAFKGDILLESKVKNLY